MDQRLPYEEIISGKLQSLPVPDLADAIWARVERQLDIDLPTNEGGGASSPASGPGAGPISWGLSIFLVALITIFLISKNNKKTSGTNPVRSVQKIEVPQNPGPQKEQNTRTADKVQIQPGKRSQPSALPVDSSVATTMDPVVPSVADTTLGRPEPLVVVPTVIDSVKKKRGVPGLSDGDYRIVPKKDNR